MSRGMPCGAEPCWVAFGVWTMRGDITGNVLGSAGLIKVEGGISLFWVVGYWAWCIVYFMGVWIYMLGLVAFYGVMFCCGSIKLGGWYFATRVSEQHLICSLLHCAKLKDSSHVVTIRYDESTTAEFSYLPALDNKQLSRRVMSPSESKPAPLPGTLLRSTYTVHIHRTHRIHPLVPVTQRHQNVSLSHTAGGDEQARMSHPVTFRSH